MRVRKVTGRHLDPGCRNRFQVSHVVVVEVKVGKDLGTVGPMSKSAQIDVLAVHQPTLGQAPHRGGLAGQENGTQSARLPFGEAISRLVRGRKEDVYVSGPEPVEVLLPLALRKLVVHDDVTVGSELVTPADNHLSVDQPLVDPIKDDRHLGVRRRRGLDCLTTLRDGSRRELMHRHASMENEVEEHGEIHAANDGASLSVLA